jgi:TetR/AcrR family transcriptional repressor of nem operon
LFVKALEAYQSAGSAKLCDIANSGGSAKETVKTLLEYIIGELLGDRMQKGCFMVNAEVEIAPHDPEVSKLVCQNDQQVEDVFYQVIKKGQESGEIANRQDARALARFTFNTVKGIRVTAKSTVDKSVFDDIIRLALSALD